MHWTYSGSYLPNNTYVTDQIEVEQDQAEAELDQIGAE